MKHSVTMSCLTLAAALSFCGCSEEQSTDSAVSADSSNQTPSPAATTRVKPEAKHAAGFMHQFPEGKENGNGASGGITPTPTEGQPYYGFDGENYTSETEYKGKAKSVNFKMTLLDHRDGKDVYEITRTVSVRVTDGNTSSETKMGEKVITVEYAGEELTVFDDEHGISKFVPAPTVQTSE